MGVLIWAALGAFAVGTEGFLIAPLLPEMAGDLGVSSSMIGLTVSVFSITYALGSPIAAALTAGVDRRKLLTFALILFTIANLIAAASASYAWLVAARIVAAAGAGLYMPAASATAVLIAPPEKRGRAIAIVVAGITVSVAAGAPIGAWIGHQAGWRAAFLAVAVLSAVAAIALRFGLPAGLRAPTTTLKARIDTARRPEILGGLGTTLFWSAAGFTVYTYISPFLTTTAGATAATVDAIVLLFGLGAAVGITLGGWSVDRWGTEPCIRASLGGMLLAFAGLGAAAWTLPPGTALWAMIPAVVLWGVAGWAFNPVQGVRLVERAPAHAGVTLSLNAAMLQLGAGLGAGLGSWMIDRFPVDRLPLASILLFVVAFRSLSWGRNERRSIIATGRT